MYIFCVGWVVKPIKQSTASGRVFFAAPCIIITVYHQHFQWSTCFASLVQNDSGTRLSNATLALLKPRSAVAVLSYISCFVWCLATIYTNVTHVKILHSYLLYSW